MKNSNSILYQVIQELLFPTHLLMTGTPIQFSLEEL
jgi:SNF2 family DNA or RNA helicase